MPVLYPGASLFPGGTVFPADDTDAGPLTGANRLYERILPIRAGDVEAGSPLFSLCEALTLGSQAFEEIVREDDTHPAWARAVDANEAPGWVLPWLGSLVGVEVIPGESEAKFRNRLITRPRWKRGTPDAMRNAVLDTLDHTATIANVRLVARANGPWGDALIISTSHTPNQTVTTAAAMSEKSAGRLLEITYSDDPVIDDGTLTIDDVAMSMDAVSVADVS